MKLCVGAASRRVVEEAATLQVAQIVASRRQVGGFEPGYTGFTSETLVDTVKRLSDGFTDVIRDHGGPYQNGNRNDDWTAELDQDAKAGFDGLHLDVSQLPRADQLDELVRLCDRYAEKIDIEIGGERDPQHWLNTLLDCAIRACAPRFVIIAAGGHIWADRQCGDLASIDTVKGIVNQNHADGVLSKAHNMDWIGMRNRYDVAGLHAYNIAPEFGNVEIDAWLHVLPMNEVRALLEIGYSSKRWERWFRSDEGTYIERARAGLRYLTEESSVTRILDQHDDTYVREAIREAIAAG